jgi:hypothetical protein
MNLYRLRLGRRGDVVRDGIVHSLRLICARSSVASSICSLKAIPFVSEAMVSVESSDVMYAFQHCFARADKGARHDEDDQGEGDK